MNPILLSILLGLTASAANVFGGAVIVQHHWERNYLRYFVALGAGFMLATALVEMVPESLALTGHVRARCCCWADICSYIFSSTPSRRTSITAKKPMPTNIVHSHRRMSVLFGLMIHTFFDGIAITAGFLISPLLGWIIFLAIFLHKIPEGFTVTSVMLASGLSKGRSWFASVLLACPPWRGAYHGDRQTRGELWLAHRRGSDNLRRGVRPDPRSESRAWSEDGAGGVYRCGDACSCSTSCSHLTLRTLCGCATISHVLPGKFPSLSVDAGLWLLPMCASDAEIPRRFVRSRTLRRLRLLPAHAVMGAGILRHHGSSASSS